LNIGYFQRQLQSYNTLTLKSEGSRNGGINDIYALLDLDLYASTDQIIRAYHEELAAWRGRGSNFAEQRFALIGSAVYILRHAEERDRYDYFLETGQWPRWGGEMLSATSPPNSENNLGPLMGAAISVALIVVVGTEAG